MGLSSIFKKSQELGKKSLKTFLQINKYDDPANAMELISHICTEGKDIEFTDELYPVMEILFDMEEEGGEKFKSDNNFIKYIKDLLDALEKSYLDNTYQLKIAVSGGYSAGKSTFMNMLIGQKNFLPTDMNPTSLVNTFLNFNGSIKHPVVRGENINSNLVLLDEDVLASIRHDTQNAKSIANILKRLIIDIPSTNYLDGITFIDTPGYDNAIKVNRENGTTDKETAANAFKDADVIFWCAKIQTQLTSEDIKFIQENGGKDKPVIILLSRMKDIAQSLVPVNVKSCYDTAVKSLNNVVDVIAFDRDAKLDDIYSIKRNSLSQLFNKIKTERSESVVDMISFLIEDAFDEKMKTAKEHHAKYKKEYEEIIKKLNEARKNNSNRRIDINDLKGSLKDIIIDSYNDLIKTVSDLGRSGERTLNDFKYFFDKVKTWDKTDHNVWNDNTLTPILSKGLSGYQVCVNRHKSAKNYELPYSEELRRNFLKDFERVSQSLENQDVYDVDYYENRKTELSNGISAEMTCQQFIAKYKPLVLSAVAKADVACHSKRSRHYKSLEQITKTKDKDVFSAISGNNMERFILCFHTGVELSTCNSQGYNVLTWIATFGNTEMLDFILKHKNVGEGVDLTIKDKNGLNIMEAAIVAHNKYACMSLLKAIPSLKVTKAAASQLLVKNDFNSWINNNL